MSQPPQGLSFFMESKLNYQVLYGIGASKRPNSPVTILEPMPLDRPQKMGCK